MLTVEQLKHDLTVTFPQHKIYFAASEVPSHVQIPEGWDCFGIDIVEAAHYPRSLAPIFRSVAMGFDAFK